MQAWTRHRRRETVEMRPWTPEDASDWRIDKRGFTPHLGDMVARNPFDEGEMWVVPGGAYSRDWERVE